MVGAELRRQSSRYDPRASGTSGGRATMTVVKERKRGTLHMKVHPEEMTGRQPQTSGGLTGMAHMLRNGGGADRKQGEGGISQ